MGWEITVGSRRSLDSISMDSLGIGIEDSIKIINFIGSVCQIDCRPFSWFRIY